MDEEILKEYLSKIIKHNQEERTLKILHTQRTINEERKAFVIAAIATGICQTAAIALYAIYKEEFQGLFTAANNMPNIYSSIKEYIKTLSPEEIRAISIGSTSAAGTFLGYISTMVEAIKVKRKQKDLQEMRDAYSEYNIPLDNFWGGPRK